jgi:hypothetical protein
LLFFSDFEIWSLTLILEKNVTISHSYEQNFPMLPIILFSTIYNLTVCSLGTLNPSEQFSICCAITWHAKSLKFVYITLLKTLTHLPIHKFLKWEEILGIDIADWSIYFRILKKCCRDTYLINLQYKFLHRVIPTNTFLFKIHIKDTKLCNVEDETVEHLFFTCPLIFPFLRAFYDCLKCYFHNIEFHKEKFLLGFKEESLTLNLLILIAKNCM